MKKSQLAASVIDKLNQRLVQRSLKLEKRDKPINSSFSEEWVVVDSDEWSYASFGLLLNGGYGYTLANSRILPFEAKEIIDWIGSEIIRIVGDTTTN